MVTRSSILDQVIDSQKGDLPRELAEYLLSLGFPASAQERYTQLAHKSQEGELSSEERIELEDFVNVGTFLTILQSKARLSLRRQDAA